MKNKYVLYYIICSVLIVFMCKCTSENRYKSDVRVSSFITDSLAIWLVLNEDSITNLDIETKCEYTYSLLENVIIPEAKKTDRTFEILFSFWEDKELKPVWEKSLYGNVKTIEVDNLVRISGSSSRHNKKSSLSVSNESIDYLADFKINSKYCRSCIYSHTKYNLRCGLILEMEIYYDPK